MEISTEDKCSSLEAFMSMNMRLTDQPKQEQRNLTSISYALICNPHKSVKVSPRIGAPCLN